MSEFEPNEVNNKSQESSISNPSSGADLASFSMPSRNDANRVNEQENSRKESAAAKLLPDFQIEGSDKSNDQFNPYTPAGKNLQSDKEGASKAKSIDEPAAVVGSKADIGKVETSASSKMDNSKTDNSKPETNVGNKPNPMDDDRTDKDGQNKTTQTEDETNLNPRETDGGKLNPYSGEANDDGISQKNDNGFYQPDFPASRSDSAGFKKDAPPSKNDDGFFQKDAPASKNDDGFFQKDFPASSKDAGSLQKDAPSGKNYSDFFKNDPSKKETQAFKVSK